MMLIKVSIPSFRKVDDDHDKSFTVFCIDVVTSIRHYTIERRYNEFDELNRRLRRQVVTPLFPAKSVLKWNQKVLEHRREAFEHYLQTVVEGSRIPRCLLHFLEISLEERAPSTESLDQLLVNGKCDTTTQPMIAFPEECFLQEPQRRSLPDIITAGVVKGLYGDEEQ